MNLHPLIIFTEKTPSEIVLGNNTDKLLFREISINNLKSFYLDKFLTANSSIKQKQNFYNSRNYFLKSGLIISILDTDTDLNYYNYSLPRKEFSPFNYFVPKGKIINITYQDVCGKNKFHQGEKVNLHELWRENYNNWLKDYYPKIKNRL